jgi:hypothetical protein
MEGHDVRIGSSNYPANRRLMAVPRRIGICRFGRLVPEEAKVSGIGIAPFTSGRTAKSKIFGDRWADLSRERPQPVCLQPKIAAREPDRPAHPGECLKVARPSP